MLCDRGCEPFLRQILDRWLGFVIRVWGSGTTFLSFSLISVYGSSTIYINYLENELPAVFDWRTVSNYIYSLSEWRNPRACVHCMSACIWSIDTSCKIILRLIDVSVISPSRWRTRISRSSRRESTTRKAWAL